MIFGWTCFSLKKKDWNRISRTLGSNLPIRQRGLSTGNQRPWLQVKPDGPWSV